MNSRPNLEIQIERWRAGDEKAAETIYKHHRERVYRLSFALLGNSDDAEEAAQDALTYALLNIHNFDERRSKFATWLHMITVSRSRDILRKRKLPAISLTDWIFGRGKKEEDDPGPEAQVIQEEKRNTIWESIQELDTIYREAIVLRHWGGHTYQEIGDIVGCPIRTAQSRVRLAYQKLEKKLISLDSVQFSEENK